MTTVEFASGRKLDVLCAREGAEFLDGFERRVLTLEFDPAVMGLDKMNALVSDAANTQVMVLEDEGQAVFDHYVLKARVSAEPVAVGLNADGSRAVEERLLVKLARRSPFEIQLEEMRAAMVAGGLMEG